MFGAIKYVAGFTAKVCVGAVGLTVGQHLVYLDHHRRMKDSLRELNDFNGNRIEARFQIDEKYAVHRTSKELVGNQFSINMIDAIEDMDSKWTWMSGAPIRADVGFGVSVIRTDKLSTFVYCVDGKSFLVEPAKNGNVYQRIKLTEL